MNNDLIPVLGPTWMGDLNILITAPSNAALLSKTQTAISLLLDACAKFQMQPNLCKGKTEVMFHVCGHRAKEFRRTHYSAPATLPVICERTTHHISIVRRYVHLGGLIHHRDVNRSEIRKRFAIANQAFQHHKRVLFRNPAFSWMTRCEMFQSLVMSKFVYGLESWTFSSHSSKLQVHNGIMRLYRRVLGLSPQDRMTEDELLVQAKFPSPTEVLRRARLRYFGTLHNCKHSAHWGILQEDKSWVALIQDDATRQIYHTS